MEKTCRQCGETFTAKRAATLTCSKRCNTNWFHAREREARAAARVTAACATCGKDFHPARPASRACSRDCYRALVAAEDSARRKAARRYITCDVCGCGVMARLKSQTRCGSAECQKAPRAPSDRDRDSYLRRRFGVGLVDYRRMERDQGGVCAICGQLDATGRRLAVDHDHETGAVRGLLCFRCNVALGKFNDDADLLRSAIDYIEGARRVRRIA